MEDNTKALEVVCRHFQNEFADKQIRSLRKRINRSDVTNTRLRQRNKRLEEELMQQNNSRLLLNQILQLLLRKMDLILKSRADQIANEST